MSLLRKMAVGLLRRTAVEGDEWARAMLCELDAIENDWAAFHWALGGTTAMMRRRGKRWFAGMEIQEEGRTMKEFLRNTAGMMLGVVLAVALAFGAYGLLLIAFHFFPVLEAGRVPWVAWIFVFAIPETIFVVGAMRLWRKHRPLAVGIAVSAAIFVTHFVMHVASHWDGQ